MAKLDVIINSINESTTATANIINKTHYRRFDIGGGKNQSTFKEFNLIDYTYSNKSNQQINSPSELRSTVPKLIVYEYQPDLFFNWAQKWKKIESL